VSAKLGRVRNAAAVARKGADGLRWGWRLALLEQYLLVPGIHPRVRQLLAGSGRHLLLACMPKSGSTFLSTALAAATGFRLQTFGWGFEQNEQDLYLPELVRHYRSDTVTQQHMRASDPNLRLVGAFGIIPIVLVRGLEDVVVSLFDHMAHDAQRTPMAFVDEGYRRLAPAAQADFIIELFMPWYVSFYVSWREAERAGKCTPIWVRYEEMIKDPARAIAGILARSGVDCTRARIDAGVARALKGKVRFNKGVAGRGSRFLTDAQRGRIAALGRHYPAVDFSWILK